MAPRVRRFGSLSVELLNKSREAMLTAVQIHNNPQIEFKSELFIVTAIIAWTYLLHAYYRKNRVNIREQLRVPLGRKKYATTPRGAVRLWSLEACLGYENCPVDEIVKKNLLFLIGIRHEIEHQGTTQIDDAMSAKFMAAALNFNTAMTTLFGPKHSLAQEQAFSIQFSTIDETTVKTLLTHSDLPANIRSYINEFQTGMSPDEFNDPRFSYRVAFFRKLANGKSSADRVVEFIPSGTTETEVNNAYISEREQEKMRPGSIVAQMQKEGHRGFRPHHHTELWQAQDAKNPKYRFGVLIDGTWFWYKSWLEEVRLHCQEKRDFYRTWVPIKDRQKQTAHPHQNILQL